MKFSKKNSEDINNNKNNTNNEYENQEVFSTAKENLEYVKKIQGESWDLVTKEITLKNENQEINISIAYFAGLVDQTFLNKVVNDVIANNFQNLKEEIDDGNKRVDYFKKIILTTISTDDADKYAKIFNTLLSGDMILFIDNVKKAIIIGARKYVERGVDKPSTQITVKGSQDAFNENLLTNVSLIRRRIKNPNLWVKNYIIGKESNTNVSVIYLNGIADEKIVEEVNNRIKKMEPENIIDSSYVKEYLKEKQFSIFPIMFDSERPDTIVGNILEGRVAIAVDTSPFVLIAPSLFIQYFHSTDDFHSAGIIATFFRLLRILAFFLAMYFPALYISLLLHHSELLPVNLLYSIQGQRITTPFPSYLELLIILLLFDLLREAGARMPTAIGSSISFVGAIIIGQASVEAGLISSIVVIIAAISGISALIMPNYQMSLTVTVTRYVVTIITIFLGFFGFTLCMGLIIIHLCSLRSFGVNYLSPFTPMSLSGQKDAILRFSLKNLFKRTRKFYDKYPH